MTKANWRSGLRRVLATLLLGLGVVLVMQARKGGTDERQVGGSQTDGDGPTPEFVNSLVRDLEQRQFQVSQGGLMLYPADACPNYTYPALKNCYANNPAAPYAIPFLKPWPDEYVDPTTVNAFGQTPPGTITTYRLDPREALVIFGRLPPPGKYMGLQTFLFSYVGSWAAEDFERWAQTPNSPIPFDYLFNRVPPDDPNAPRIQSTSALSNVINNVVIERQSGSAFGETRYFIVTPDASVERAVRGSLQGLGVRDRDIFTERIPPSDEFGDLPPLGLGEGGSDFFTTIRFALPDDPQAGDAWRQELPLAVLRVRAATSQNGAREPYPALVFDPRTAADEEELRDDLQALVTSVCDRARGAPWNLEAAGCADPAPDEGILKDPVADLGWAGPYCRSIGMNCLGDQQESAYFFASPRPLDSGEVYAVVGTLATETGNATYVALSVNNAATLNGVANILHTTLRGSASAYASSVANDEKLFVHYFTRDCEAVAGLTGGACTEITADMVPPSGDTAAPGNPALKGTFSPSLRAYVRPGTTRGPDSTKMLRPRVLSFTPKGSASPAP